MQKNNKIILGTVQFGLDYGINNSVGKPDRKVVYDILAEAYKNGVHILDTAEAYGEAHNIIGEFHVRFPECKFDIITKLPHHFNDDIEYKVNDYIKQLSVNKLMALMFHSFSTYKQHIDEVDTLVRLKTIGKLGMIGVSLYGNEEVLEVIDDDRIDLIQLPFNLFDNLSLRGDVMQRAKDKGKIIHTRSAFLQGLFFKNVEDPNRIVKGLKNELELINSVALRNDISLASLALNYSLDQKNIDQVLIGVDSVEHLIQNINAIKNHLGYEVIDEINKIHITTPNLINPSLWSL